jgi:anthranilate synthase/aminodeoxychorismate synthase-like glutamine amidotransferase
LLLQVVLSPGPGNPSDFSLSTSIEFLIKHKIPGFGVCLGLQGMVEHFGGTLGVLGYPMHGKPSEITLTREGVKEGSIFDGLPEVFEVARYHSLHGIKDKMPPELKITALTEDGIVMGIQHESLPFAAVQFHPESILTSPAHGMTILENVIRTLKYEEDEFAPKSGAAIVSALEKLSLEELQARLGDAGLATTGSKSELVVRLTLYTHKSNEMKAGRLSFSDLAEAELLQLKQGLGLESSGAGKAELVESLGACLMQ